MSEPALTGRVDAFRLADVLSFLTMARKSGRLHVQQELREASLYFDEGDLVFASSNQESLRLGSILLRKRRISRDQRDRIDELMQREGGRFGSCAVQEGVLTDAQLRDFLKIQVSEIVYDTFVWDSGSFTFFEELSLPAHAVTIAIDLPNLIMEGARRIQEWERCLRLLPDRSAVFRVVATPRDEKITLTADEWKILFLINGQRTLEELCAHADDDPLQVYRLVYGLLANKLIEPSSTRTAEDTGADRRTSAVATGGDATVRQGPPRFGAESTVRDENVGDDTSLLVSEEARFSYSDVVRPTIAQLRVAGGESDGKAFPLSEPEYLLGRHRDNAIALGDPGVSSFHARIYRGAEGYVIEDLKSRNGTWVNHTRVFHATLVHGDRVHVGQTDLVYELLF